MLYAKAGARGVVRKEFLMDVGALHRENKFFEKFKSHGIIDLRVVIHAYLSLCNLYFILQSLLLLF